MAVLIGQAERSGSLRWVKPSMRRLATCPGAGAVSQPSIGANSQASGLLVPPARRYFRYCTASRPTVPTAPASRPAATAARGVIGCLRVRMAGLQSGCYGFRARARPGRPRAAPRGRFAGKAAWGQELRRVVGGQVVQVPVLLGGQVGVPVGVPDAPVAVRDARGVGDLAEVLADRLPGDFVRAVAEV